jgi:formamidopyrimidine-DNA glycosylase
MPELPEVTTTVNGLQKVLPGLVFKDVWTDLTKKKTIKQFNETIKNEKFFQEFKKKIIGKKILKVERRAKNILIHISGGYSILIHLKMTGHLLFGEYEKVVSSKQKVVGWKPHKDERKELHDPYNRFIHVVFTFGKGKNLAFCDSRKFGKVTITKTSDLEDSHFKNTGPEPLEKSFTFTKFKEALETSSAKASASRRIKTVLMDQSIIAGIGNIYSDEMLWLASIHPESNPNKIPKRQMGQLYKAMKLVLLKGIDFGGDSMSDYRNIDGKRGNFQNEHNVYQKKNEKCGRKGCRGVIMRKVINGRSAHFCNNHQKMFN